MVPCVLTVCDQVTPVSLLDVEPCIDQYPMIGLLRAGLNCSLGQCIDGRPDRVWAWGASI